MIKVGRWLGLFAAICLITVMWGSVQAQAQDSEYFAQTGHNVQGEFLRYYRSVANPTLLFGYPITEQFTSKEGKLVQYFQRARFELRPDLPEGQRVQLTALGRGTYVPGKQLVIDNPLACGHRQSPGLPKICRNGLFHLLCLPGILRPERRPGAIWLSHFTVRIPEQCNRPIFRKSALRMASGTDGRPARWAGRPGACLF